MAQRGGRSEAYGELSPVGKGGEVGFVDFLHLVDGESERVGDGGSVIDFVQGQRAALAGFEILVEHLITADVEVPNRWRQGPEALGLVNRDRLVLGRIPHELDFVIAPAVIFGQATTRKFTEEVRLHQRSAEQRKPLEIIRVLGKGHPGKADAQEFRVASAIVRRV